MKVETGDSQDLKYGVYRVTRPPLLRCRLTWAGLERARVCARLGQNRAEDLGKPLRWHGFLRSPQHHKCSAVDGREPWDPKWRGCPRKRCGAGLGQGRFLLLYLRCASSLMLAAKASLFWKAYCSVIGPWLPKSPRSETSGVSSILDLISKNSTLLFLIHCFRASCASARFGSTIWRSEPKSSGQWRPCLPRTFSCAPGRPPAPILRGRARSHRQ